MQALFYQQQGKGFPVVFLHGFCESSEIWKPVIQELSAQFKTISIDLPGFSKSESLGAPQSIDHVASIILSFLKEDLQVTECALFGHSLGGYVALAMVEKDPDLFSRFGLVHSTAYADSEERKISRGKVIEFVSSHGVESFIRSFIPPLFYGNSNEHISSVIEIAAKTSTETLITYTKSMRDRMDRQHVLKAFPRPILFLGGAEDTVIPSQSIQDQSALCKYPQLSILQRVGHMGMLENAGETSRILLKFLRKNSPEE